MRTVVRRVGAPERGFAETGLGAPKVKEHPEKEGWEPFFPDFLFKEALVALAAFIVLILVVVYFKVPLEPIADPTDTTYTPRPEWYFLFFFELLKYFPGAWEPVATTVIPGGIILLLVLLPFFDRKEERRPQRRPLALATATGLMAGIVYLTMVGSQPPETVASQVSGERGAATTAVRRLTPIQAAGKSLFRSQNCDGCHAIAGEGGTTAPDLTRVGNVRNAQWIHTYLENPKWINPNAAMPGYLDKMTHQEAEEIAQYLAILK